MFMTLNFPSNNFLYLGYKVDVTKWWFTFILWIKLIHFVIQNLIYLYINNGVMGSVMWYLDSLSDTNSESSDGKSTYKNSNVQVITYLRKGN